MAGDDSARSTGESHKTPGVGSTQTLPGPPAPRRDASMSLLRDLMENTLDAGYAEAAERRRRAVEQGRGGARRSSRAVALVGVALVGLLLATSALQLRAHASRKDHNDLVSRVKQATKATDQVAADVDRLRAQIAAARADGLALTTAGRAASDQLAALEVLSGAVPVTGPGLLVTVDDAKSAGQVDSTGQPRLDTADDPGRVRDRDLQKVVNGLWAAGAEAIAVNGQRLTATTAIRNAGQAILVAYRPLQPPYVISAIGDPATLQPSFEDTVGGAYLRLIGQTYGIRYREDARDAADALALPAADGLTVRRAEVPTPTPVPAPAASTAGSTAGSTASSAPGSASSTGPAPR
ncbi:MAG: DUF881 domain-containing protein [Motilibacteraceae bacterium]